MVILEVCQVFMKNKLLTKGNLYLAKQNFTLSLFTYFTIFAFHTKKIIVKLINIHT